MNGVYNFYSQYSRAESIDKEPIFLVDMAEKFRITAVTLRAAATELGRAAWLNRLD